MMNLTDALSIVKSRQRQDFNFFRIYIAREYPNTMQALQIIDKACTEPRKRKGYNLVKRESKKHGFLYYVRYFHEGKLLPSKWNTHTNILPIAEDYAEKNKESIIDTYMNRHKIRTHEFLEEFFEAESPCLASEEKRNRPLSEKLRMDFYGIITKKFVPFLKEEKIQSFDRITKKTLSDFQDWLLAGKQPGAAHVQVGRKLKPQTVNSNLTPVKMVFQYLERKGLIKQNPCTLLSRIPVHEEDKRSRGCYEVERLKGVFNHGWENEGWYMLCLLVYTTGMRNSEIRGMGMEDIISIEGCRFIDIKESKTKSGIRIVPLHERVYEKLAAYAGAKGTGAPFREYTPADFTEAAGALAKELEVSEEEAAQNITFYSGRHFWKTLMNSEELGEDIEEIFMGHRVSGDVSKLYNHRDKQGKKSLIRKARHVFAILDKQIFGHTIRKRQ
jgi:integrase